MSTISAATVKALRDRTNAPMMECKEALTQCNGDMDKAIEFLRSKIAGLQAKKGDREAAEGRIGLYIEEGKVGAILEMRCETAPSAKNEIFINLTNELARQVALQPTDSVEAFLSQPLLSDPKRTVNDRIGDAVGVIRENMKPARFKRIEGLTGGYVHHDGTVGVLVSVAGARADTQLLRDVCMHIAATTPQYARKEEVPADVLAKEQEIARAQIAADPKNASKPAQIIEKIAEGKVKTWLGQNVLTEQPFVKDDSKTVGQLLQSAGLTLKGYVRYKIGELS